MTDRPPPPVPDQLLRRLADDRDAARERVERLTAELTDARQQLERLEATHQMLLELAGTAAPPLPPAYRDILDVLTSHPDGIRPKVVALALSLPATSKNTVEGIRANSNALSAETWPKNPKPDSLPSNKTIPNEQPSEMQPWSGCGMCDNRIETVGADGFQGGLRNRWGRRRAKADPSRRIER